MLRFTSSAAVMGPALVNGPVARAGYAALAATVVTVNVFTVWSYWQSDASAVPRTGWWSGLAAVVGCMYVIGLWQVAMAPASAPGARLRDFVAAEEIVPLLVQDGDEETDDIMDHRT